MRKVLVVTMTHGRREFIKSLIPALRHRAGCSFDWMVIGNGIPVETHEYLSRQLEEGNIQAVLAYNENKGQHVAMRDAWDAAREGGYDWLLRVDDDVIPKSGRIISKMLDRALYLKDIWKHDTPRTVICPRILGLRNPIPSSGVVDIPESGFPIGEIVFMSGGAFRMMPVPFFKDFRVDIFAPMGRLDPEMVAQYIVDNKGLIIRYPDLKVWHKTDENERKDTPEEAYERKMARFWPYLGETTQYGSMAI